MTYKKRVRAVAKENRKCSMCDKKAIAIVRRKYVCGDHYNQLKGGTQ